MSYYLSKAGARVCLVEAGKFWQADTWPDNELEANANLMWNGGMDSTQDAGMVLLRGKVVGGGTIINNCLLDRFDDIALDDFRHKSGVDFYQRDTMDCHYSAIEQQLSLETIQESDWNGNAKLYAEGFDKLGLKRAPLRRSQHNCQNDRNDCIVCLGGCPRESKQSMAVSFIPKALKEGLTLVDQFQVHQVVHGKSHVAVHGQRENHRQTLYARKCIVAAGALGSTGLLLRSGYGDQLPALGQGFHCHPQFMSIALMDEIVDSHKGAFQSLKSDDPRFRAQGFKLENVFAGPVAISLLKAGFGEQHQNFMQQYHRMACIEVAVRDEVPGTLRHNRNGRLVIDKTLDDVDKQRSEAGLQQIRDIFAAVGAREVMESPLVIALHLMGGCSIGQHAANSVVNEQFQVHGFENLMIADGAIYPMAPGINPSLTIMAQSHRAAECILNDFGEHSITQEAAQSIAAPRLQEVV